MNIYSKAENLFYIKNDRIFSKIVYLWNFCTL